MGIKIPQHLHRPMNFIIFESDDLAVGCAVFSILLSFNLPLLLFLSIIIATMTIYRSQKRKANRGFLKHIGYMIGTTKFKGFPSSKVDELLEM